MQDAGAENTWQEDMDMPDASPTPSALVDVASHSGFGPPHLILAARRPTHSHLSQSLLHRITWHEADSVAQHEVDQHLKGGADKFGNTLPHYTWKLNDPTISHEVTTIRQAESVFSSNSEFAVYQYLVATRTSHTNANRLLRIVSHPDFNPMYLRFGSIEAYHRRVDDLQQDGMLYRNMHEPIDGDQIVEFFFRQSTDVMKEILSCATSIKHCTFTFTPTFEATSGERTYGEFMSACWAEMIEALVDKEGCFVCPFVLGSDGESSKYEICPARCRAPEYNNLCMCVTDGWPQIMLYMLDMWGGHDHVPVRNVSDGAGACA
jgi:hypothetical protein